MWSVSRYTEVKFIGEATSVTCEQEREKKRCVTITNLQFYQLERLYGLFPAV